MLYTPNLPPKIQKVFLIGDVNEKIFRGLEVIDKLDPKKFISEGQHYYDIADEIARTFFKRMKESGEYEKIIKDSEYSVAIIIENEDILKTAITYYHVHIVSNLEKHDEFEEDRHYLFYSVGKFLISNNGILELI